MQKLLILDCSWKLEIFNDVDQATNLKAGVHEFVDRDNTVIVCVHRLNTKKNIGEEKSGTELIIAGHWFNSTVKNSQPKIMGVYYAKLFTFCAHLWHHHDIPQLEIFSN